MHVTRGLVHRPYPTWRHTDETLQVETPHRRGLCLTKKLTVMTKSEFHDYYAQQMNRTFRVDGETYNLVQLGWSYDYGTTKRALGRCIYHKGGKGTKKIEISRAVLDIKGQNMAEMQDTVLHEIAHAIDVEQRGHSNHDHNWKRIARQVGADPTRTTDRAIMPKGAYILRCDTCGHEAQAYKQHSRKKACGKCCKANGGGYQERFVLRQYDAHTGEEVGYKTAPRRRRRSTTDWFPTMGF